MKLRAKMDGRNLVLRNKAKDIHYLIEPLGGRETTTGWKATLTFGEKQKPIELEIGRLSECLAAVFRDYFGERELPQENPSTDGNWD